MFEQSLKLLLSIPKLFNAFNAFQVLKWFPFLLRVNGVIFARAINTDVWQAMVARALLSRRKTIVSQLKRRKQRFTPLSGRDLDPKATPMIYTMTRVTFEVVSSPFLPIGTIQ